ncbi:MAG: aminotransferase class V-fold PLP-dependent enzyme [Anaerolineae bacterium]|nr:aminotransferase class V-fold PLP-dependent enzyme [Anaerolineae bacterium]
MLTREWRLLNNGSFGACPKPVFEVYQRWQAEFEQHPGEFVGRWRALMDESRAKLAAYLHTEGGRLAFVTNATMGVNAVTHSLRSWLKPGDEVLTTNHEYGACNHAWQFNCQKAGAAYVQLPHRSAHSLERGLHRKVLGRRHPAHAGHLPQPHHLAHGAHVSAASAVPSRARGGHIERDRRRACARPARSLSRRA